jgi:hypothetical protein
MGNTPAAGNGPFEFTNAQGHQMSVPLTAFTFDSNSNLIVNAAWATVMSASPASELMAYAQKNKLIAPATPPAPVPAMIIKATDPGAAGNYVTVQISGIAPAADPTQTTFIVAVTETDTYTGLTAATIQSVLGTCDSTGKPLTTGSSPGLVQVLSGSVDPNSSPAAISGALSGNPAHINLDGPGSPALVFTLMAKKAGAAGAYTKIHLVPAVTSPPASGPDSFNLTVTWTNSVAGVTIGTLAAAVQNSLCYEITVGTPGSAAFSVPAASSVTLSGGAPGVRASGVVFTGAS